MLAFVFVLYFSTKSTGFRRSISSTFSQNQVRYKDLQVNLQKRFGWFVIFLEFQLRFSSSRLKIKITGTPSFLSKFLSSSGCSAISAANRLNQFASSVARLFSSCRFLASAIFPQQV
jgi:hypothetical protein